MTEEELDHYEGYLKNHADTLDREAQEKKLEADGVRMSLAAFQTMRNESRRKAAEKKP